MAPLPKRRISSARQGKRRASIALKAQTLVNCSNCGSLKLPHVVCANCGTYKGVVYVAPKIKTKVTKVRKEKEG
ncbi:MAG TPA: 50S ribosomal protein L32 [Candidatus Nanoarchaeia archaeon]|nr:50S ribosomal protein L32 [uncultured archaeon]